MTCRTGCACSCNQSTCGCQEGLLPPREQRTVPWWQQMARDLRRSLVTR